jgi:uncharacterized membrane protein YphA (DoxX/SURF4 family)
MSSMDRSHQANYTSRMNGKRLFITFLRMAIGWHFFYEGVSKWIAPDWTAHGYLVNATGFLSGFYHGLASSPAAMSLIDPLNVYGLILIGLALFLGVFIRPAAAAGAVLLGLYYFAYPPFAGAWFGSTEGNLYIVNKSFIEAAALIALLFMREQGYGLHALKSFMMSKTEDGVGEAASGLSGNSRREALKNLATVPALGIMGWGASHEHRTYGVDTLSGATVQVGRADLSELKGELPKGRIGDHEISRLVLGGNLIGGWAHARDLIYVSSLFRAYNTERKIFETLMTAEAAGINAINIGFPSNPVLQKYKKVTGSRIKVISQVAPDLEKPDYFANIDQAIDYGVDIIQIQGNQCDWLVRDKRIDVIEKMMDRIRSQGYTAGLASHTIDALIACEDAGILPDYYMKTMHHDRYWSAHPMENRVPFEVDGEQYLDHNRFHNNMFCLFPERTVEFVRRATVPVMGFKVLAAGALQPEDGFRWAFENGADFICVGMFDFQIVKDVNITLDVLNDLPKRERQWFS